MSDLSIPQKRALGQMMLEGLKKKDAEIIAGCIRRGGDPDFPVADGNSAEKPLLHWAMRYFNQAAAKTVLGASSSPDVRDADGNTALFTAIENNNAEAVTFLMKNGADMAAQNYENIVALDLARKINPNYYPEARDAILKALTADYNLAAKKPPAPVAAPVELVVKDEEKAPAPKTGGKSFEL